jgi:hypothetical protein
VPESPHPSPLSGRDLEAQTRGQGKSDADGLRQFVSQAPQERSPPPSAGIRFVSLQPLVTFLYDSPPYLLGCQCRQMQPMKPVGGPLGHRFSSMVVNPLFLERPGQEIPKSIWSEAMSIAPTFDQRAELSSRRRAGAALARCLKKKVVEKRENCCS